MEYNTKEWSSKDKHCDYNNFKRARYFHGMLLTDRDFSEEQLYHNEKRKLLNRMLHGWGVVCGLKITPSTPESSKVIIERGLALDCAGNEIFLREPYELNVIEIKDCAEIEGKGAGENKLYVVIKYQEVHTDSVSVYAPVGGCEEKVCENSRIREGYCIELCHVSDLTVKCPEQLREEGGPCEDLKNITSDLSEEANKSEVRQFLCEHLLMPCPDDCCDDPQVVLGSVTFEGGITSETIVEKNMINNWDCRKYVISFGLLQHWMNQLAPQKVPFEAIVEYALLGDGCESLDDAVEAFRKICDKQG